MKSPEAIDQSLSKVKNELKEILDETQNHLRDLQRVLPKQHELMRLWVRIDVLKDEVWGFE